MEQYAEKRGVPYADSVVIKNSIIPLESSKRKKSDKIRLVYTSTPHRGLQILIPVFLELVKQHPDLELNVYSSFKLYGWEERDAQYEELYEICRNHPNIKYHGTVSNEEVREGLLNADIFAYPSIWKETSCLCLIEAMSAGLLCIHPNLAALPETGMGLTWMYQWNEDIQAHAQSFYAVLAQGIDVMKNQREAIKADLALQKLQVDRVHSWEHKSQEWTALLQSLQQKK
jgi:glycosyltransferase involved in cell wall biosynthesis